MPIEPGGVELPGLQPNQELRLREDLCRVRGRAEQRREARFPVVALGQLEHEQSAVALGIEVRVRAAKLDSRFGENLVPQELALARLLEVVLESTFRVVAEHH